MDFNNVVLLQTLCILANIADGNTAKELIMTNDDMLQKIKYYMVHSTGVIFRMLVSILACCLLICAVACVSGSLQREAAAGRHLLHLQSHLE